VHTPSRLRQLPQSKPASWAIGAASLALPRRRSPAFEHSSRSRYLSRLTTVSCHGGRSVDRPGPGQAPLGGLPCGLTALASRSQASARVRRLLHRFSMFSQSNRHFSATGWEDTKGPLTGMKPSHGSAHLSTSQQRKALIMKPVRILLATAMAAGTVLLSASAASAATPPPAPTFGHHVSTCARTMGFSGAHNPSVMRGGMSGMDMTMTTSPVA